MNPSFRKLYLTSAILLFANAVFSQSKGYDVISYNAELTVMRTDSSIAGKVTMTARADQDLESILQHAKYLSIDSVFINGVNASIANPGDTIFVGGDYWVDPTTPIPSGSTFELVTYYHGKGMPEQGVNAWGGIQHDPKMMYAMGVGFHAPYISCTRHWLPCYDLPDDKADSVILGFFTDENDLVVSNGLRTSFLVSTQGITYAKWETHDPIATYLLTFAVGDLERVATPNPKNIPFDTYGLAADTAKAAALMSKRVVNALVYFDSLFAPYPFEKVGYVVANIGSMEHQTMVTLVRQALDTNSTTAVHELAHMWFGDWITCKDFNDPWLNEGFATYCEALFRERFFGKAAYWKEHKSNVSGAITTGSAIPLYGTPLTTKPASNYPSGVLYQKGAAVLGMLRYFIGDSLFFTAVREYGKRHGYSTATSFDLEDAFEDVTQQDLDWFFKKWVHGISYPRLRVRWSRVGTNITVNFEDTTAGSYFRLPLVIEVMTKGGELERHTVWLDSTKISEATFTASFEPDSMIVDPDGAVIKKIVGRVTLGVEPEDIGRIAGLTKAGIYLMTFTPNPSQKSEVILALSPAPAIYNADLPSSTYANRQMAELLTGKYKLALYDSNAKQVLIQDLINPTVGTRSPIEVNPYMYTIDTSKLQSGTYLAVILLTDYSNVIAGHGRLVIQR